MFRLRPFLLSFMLLAVVFAPAHATDMPVIKAPRAAIANPSSDDWSGFYVGLDAGYGWGWSRWSDPLGGSGAAHLEGTVLGGHLGFNWQRGPLVLGVETDAAWANLAGSPGAGIGFCATGPCETKQNWIGTTRGRIGYAFGYWMPYLTGGLAYGGVEQTLPWGSASTTRVGWSAGAGLEVGLSKNWSSKFEFLHLDLGTATFFNAASGASTVSAPIKDDILRAGVSYHW